MKDLAVRKSIEIKALTDKVWDAITNPSKIKEWLFGTNVITDWKVGSPIMFTGEWEGTKYEDKGEILSYNPQKSYQYSYWSGFSGLPDVPENYSKVGFEIEEAGENTILTITQSDFATETMYEHSDKNWEATMEKIRAICE